MNVAHKAAKDKIREIASKDLPSFVYIHEDQKGKESIRISPAKLATFLIEHGFGTYNDRIIHIVDNVTEVVDPQRIFQYCLQYVRTFNDENLENLFIATGESLIITKKGIILGLPACDVEPQRDTADTGYHYYRNGFVLARKEEEISLMPYSKLQGFIWKDDIIDRTIDLIPDQEINTLGEGMFAKFCSNITNNAEHYRSMVTTIGYLLHRYKDKRLVKAVILNDENLSEEGSPMGGTGKGLLMEAISQVVKTITYDGKNSNFHDDKFAYQSVDFSTSIIFIDDIRRDFKFDSLFSATTSNLVVQRKYEKQFEIDFKDSPKFAITTNYVVKGISSSDLRRKHNAFLNSHYSNEHAPADDFDCEFFTDWDDREWNLFDNFMMVCLNTYLITGLVEYRSPEIEIKMLKQETSADFWELMESDFAEPNTRYYKAGLREKMIERYGNAYEFLNKRHTVIYGWLKIYSDYKKLKIRQESDMNGAYFEFNGL